MIPQVKLEPKSEDEFGTQLDILHDGLQAIRNRHPPCVNGNCVYFVTDGYLTKIGTTGFIKPRLSTIQTNNGLYVKLHHKYDCLEAKMCEDELHILFEQQHEHGEWYRLSDAHLGLLKAVLKPRRFEVPLEDTDTCEKRVAKRQKRSIEALASNFPNLVNAADVRAFLSERAQAPAQSRSKTKEKIPFRLGGKIFNSESYNNWWEDDGSARTRESEVKIGACVFLKEDGTAWEVQPTSRYDLVSLLECDHFGAYDHFFLSGVRDKPYGIFGHTSADPAPHFNFTATIICKYMRSHLQDLGVLYFHGPAVLYVDPADNGEAEDVDWTLIQERVALVAPKAAPLPLVQLHDCNECHSTGIRPDPWEGDPELCCGLSSGRAKSPPR